MLGRIEAGPTCVLLNKITQDGVMLTDASTREGREHMTLEMVALGRGFCAHIIHLPQ